MDGIIKLIQEHGVWVFLVGVITSIIIGIIKTPIKNKVIPDGLNEGEKIKRENIFDTVTFFSTYIFAFLGAIVYYLIINRSFSILPILSLSLPIWMAQSMSYGIWKKLGLKRLLELLLKLCIKDKNNDGEITLDEALAQVKDAYKNGKLDLNTLIKDATDNAVENFDETIAQAGQELDEADKVTVNEVNQEALEATPVSESKTEDNDPIVVNISKDVAVSKGKSIKF